MKPAAVNRWYLLPSTARKVKTDLVKGRSTHPSLLETLGFSTEALHPRNPPQSWENGDSWSPYWSPSESISCPGFCRSSYWSVTCHPTLGLTDRTKYTEFIQ